MAALSRADKHPQSGRTVPFLQWRQGLLGPVDPLSRRPTRLLGQDVNAAAKHPRVCLYRVATSIP